MQVAHVENAVLEAGVGDWVLQAVGGGPAASEVAADQVVVVFAPGFAGKREDIKL